MEIAGFCRFLPGFWRWGARAGVIGIGFGCAGLWLDGGGVGLLVKVVGHDLATGIGGDYVAQEGMGDLAGALPLYDIGRRRLVAAGPARAPRSGRGCSLGAIDGVEGGLALGDGEGLGRRGRVSGFRG